MRVVAASDWVIDIGPGAGDEGRHVVASGKPAGMAESPGSRTAPYLARFLDGTHRYALPTRQRRHRSAKTSV